MKIDVSKLTRLEVFKDDQRIVSLGDDYQFSLQDEGRTLKIFMKYNREKRHEVMADMKANLHTDMEQINEKLFKPRS